MNQTTHAANEAEREVLARQAEALAAVKALPAGAGFELKERAAYLRLQLADLDLALLRIPRGPGTARRVGKLRKDRAKVDEILRELLDYIARQEARKEKT